MKLPGTTSNAIMTNFATTLKSMTPMPKLAHTFSQPATQGSGKTLLFET